MKKTFTILILFLFATQAMAINFDFSVQSNGQTLYYKKTSDKEVSVVYPNRSASDFYNGYPKPTGDLTIPQTVTDDGVTYTVTTIGEAAFSDCSGLTSVSIPNSVTSIGSTVFSQCTSLSSITFGNSVTSIGQYAFYKCSGLKSVTIGNSVTTIGDYAFRNCNGLESVAIPNAVTTIGEYVFSGCSGLTKAEFASIESLCSINFGNDSANPLSLAGHLYITGDENEVTEVVIPNMVTSIGQYAFINCSCLTSVSIPNPVTSISRSAFRGCSGLTSVTIPKSVTSIGNSAFSYCSGLTSVTIPKSVTSIGNSAFSYCSSLTSVAIPNSVTSIGESAFSDCSGLASVIVPKSVTTIGKNAFSYCSKATLYCEVEESSRTSSWNPWWNDRGGTVKWGCKVIKTVVNDEEYGAVSTTGENYAVKGDDGSLWYLKETTNGTATLTATPKDGYHFVKWEEEPDAAATLTIENVTESKTYTAVFAKDEPTSIKNNSAGSVRKVTKVLGPDGLYIIKDGVKYNLLGEKEN